MTVKITIEEINGKTRIKSTGDNSEIFVALCDAPRAFVNSTFNLKINDEEWADGIISLIDSLTDGSKKLA